jgi:hypothetical protein
MGVPAGFDVSSPVSPWASPVHIHEAFSDKQVEAEFLESTRIRYCIKRWLHGWEASIGPANDLGVQQRSPVGTVNTIRKPGTPRSVDFPS